MSASYLAAIAARTADTPTGGDGGDINYADPQRKRGGGFVCFKDRSLHDVVESMVKMADPCES